MVDFVEHQAAQLRWRGSSNQKIHFLSDTYRHLRDLSDDKTHIELLVSPDEFTTTGVWPERFLKQMVDVLSGAQS